jgi:hypothetical protein
MGFYSFFLSLCIHTAKATFVLGFVPYTLSYAINRCGYLSIAFLREGQWIQLFAHI